MSRPGEYVADGTEGITCVEDLPKAKVVERSRNRRRHLLVRCAMVPGMDRQSSQHTSRIPPRRWAIWLTALTVVLVMLWATDSLSSARVTPTFTAGLGVFVVLLLAYGARRPSSNKAGYPARAAPPELDSHPELLVAYHAITHSLTGLSGQSDEILRDTAILRLADIQEELRNLAAGKVVFSSTEAWRTAYESMLRTPGLTKYLSVARLRSEDYWRDAPGEHSIQLNYDLVQLGLRIERTLILNDFFWAAGALLPAKVLCQWMEQQYKRGIVIRLVRESEIAEEPGLLWDLGIDSHLGHSVHQVAGQLPRMN